jgi:hypothetical protein
MILKSFLIGLPMMALCLMVQVAVAYWCVRYYVQHLVTAPADSTLRFVSGVRPLVVAMVMMMVGNFLQIVLWGALFYWLGEFAEFYDAVYHSTVNFTSLGYGDIVMTKAWRLLGPLEALNGVLMLGMTAAALMVILQHMIRAQRDALLAGRSE